jgi:glycosyltransferase involved in cell wall biosynthesis
VHSVSIVLPVFNNSPSLPQILKEISETATRIAASYKVKIVAIDDGSVDESWNVLKSLSASTKLDVTIIRLSRNFGQAAAMMAGWRHCNSDLVVNMSADLQDPVSLIPRLLQEWEKGCEVVIAERESRSDHFFRRVTSAVATRILTKSLGNSQAPWFDVSLMSRRVLETVLVISGRHRFYQRDILHAGFRLGVVRYHRARRLHGQSESSSPLRLKLFMDALLDSTRGLVHFFSILSVLITIGTFIYGLWIIIARVLGLLPSTGWAPIMVTLLFSTSILTLMLSIVCQYLWRIYDSQRLRAEFVVDEVLTVSGLLERSGID